MEINSSTSLESVRR